MEINKVIFVSITLAFSLMASGCIYVTRDVTVETRFHETKEPVSGSLWCMYPIIAWPPPPHFEPKTGDGSFEIKLVNNEISCEFLLTNHGEYDSPYMFGIDLDDNEITKWADPLTSDWKMMLYQGNSGFGPPANYPQLEYRVILPE